MLIKLKNILFLYLILLSYILLILIGGATIFVPILLGLFVSPYCYYFLIISIILLPLEYIGLLTVASHLRY